ncbi:LacI family DNA-binding transcriptional regulator [Goodfellowiella coeruleoviolacea]|uniref:Transcriptional regulator, LacI family n=1 Tax=Goodfellowiella coeruleoviolacea TaxID=334858 RepID=A0AAE3GAL3_9PSEU|nr:LacI family DNA-binding transcriptional regulator [Goodfellowiella coeruleoviolacea]MCP2163484.1 transcriptional regulator, LacI family [Goodfellowiella coeruleoviolacea]
MSRGLPSAPGAPTLEDVARAAGVSRATVSRVINGTRNVDQKIQELVRQAIASTGYVPNRAARSLVTRRTGTIALVVCGAGEPRGEVFTDPFFGRVAAGVVGLLRTRGVHPVLMLADTDEARAEVLAFLRQGSADGALLVSTHAKDPLPGMLVDARLPAVLFARPAEPLPISYVDLANHTGGVLAADHLVSLGRQQVVTITGPLDLPNSQDRLTGFREAMARHGHAYVPAAAGNFTQDSGEAAMERLLAEHPGLDGVFAANDLMAQGALLALHQHGRRVPEDVALIGFDDSSAALACRPQLTTVRQPVEDMAAEMARLLLSHIDEPDRRATSVIFEPTLVPRRSA